MRSLLFGLAAAFVLFTGAVAFRLVVVHAHRGLPGCPAHVEPGHPAPVPLAGNYFQTGTVDGKWGDGLPPELPLDLAAMDRGAALYARDCRTCHGALGLGDGIMTRLPDGPRDVADLQAPDALKRSDGEIFAIVTRGKGKMVGYGDTVPANDRWEIVAYVRALQASQHAVAADLPIPLPGPPAFPKPEAGLGAPTPAEAARLHGYGWIDRRAGTAHIPIEDAVAATRDRLRARQRSAPVPAGPVTPLP